MKYFPLLWASLWRKPTRTIFTILSVIVAFLLFGLLQGVDAWLDNAVADSHVNRLYTTSRISFIEPLPISYLQRIESVPGVDEVAYFHWFGAYYQDPKQNVFSYVVDPVRAFAVYPEWKVPADQLARMVRTRDGAIVGTTLARQRGWKIGDRVPLKAPIWTRKDGGNTYTFEIVGLFTVPDQPTSEQLFLLNYDYFDEARSFGQGQVGWYAFTILDPAHASQISAAVDQAFRNSPYETRTQNEKEFAQARVKQIGDIGFMVNAIVGAVLFTLLFLTGNAMMQSVRERIPELAVLKTIGFTDAGVTTLVVVESLLLCVVAAIVGLLLASMIFPVVGSLLAGGKVLLPASVFVAGAVAAILLSLATALPPAWRASRLTVVDALAGR